MIGGGSGAARGRLDSLAECEANCVFEETRPVPMDQSEFLAIVNEECSGLGGARSVILSRCCGQRSGRIGKEVLVFRVYAEGASVGCRVAEIVNPTRIL